MSKERLEDIEKNLDPLGYGMGGHLISVKDIYWLVRHAKEQSERIQELESRIADDEHFVAEILEQNKRYREAIEVAIHNMASSDDLGVKFALGILEQVLESDFE